MAGNSVFGVVIFNAHSFSSFLWRTNWFPFPWVVSEILTNILEAQAALAPSLLTRI